jgi:hypothetical protein
VNVARVLFVLAWVSGAFWIGRRFSKGRAWLLIFLTVGVGSLIVEARPETVPRWFGVLAPRWTLFSADAEKPVIEVGDSGTMIRWKGPQGVPMTFNFFDQANLTVELIKGRVAISTKIVDTTGKIVAELKQNEWSVAQSPVTYDRNYSDDSLEVINPEGRVVLQVKALPDHIQIQGEWYSSTGSGFRIVSEHEKSGRVSPQLFSFHPGYKRCGPQIVPMFKYPSGLHFGELSDGKSETEEAPECRGIPIPRFYVP